MSSPLESRSEALRTMPEYTVFSRRILTGTISDLPYPARLAWTAILFEAERLRGRVKLPVRDLAKMASITTAEAADALRRFREPDEFSSSKEHEGRRLLPIDGEEDWYTVVTWEKHEKERQAFFNRLRQQRFREKQRAQDDDVTDDEKVTPSNEASQNVTKESEPEPKINLPLENRAMPVQQNDVGLILVALEALDGFTPPTGGRAAKWAAEYGAAWICAVVEDVGASLDGKTANYLQSVLRDRKARGWQPKRASQSRKEPRSAKAPTVDMDAAFQRAVVERRNAPEAIWWKIADRLTTTSKGVVAFGPTWQIDEWGGGIAVAAPSQEHIDMIREEWSDRIRATISALGLDDLSVTFEVVR